VSTIKSAIINPVVLILFFSLLIFTGLIAFFDLFTAAGEFTAQRYM